ncbi:MAG: BON domain-containing protein [Myxococcota bacterium]
MISPDVPGYRDIPNRELRWRIRRELDAHPQLDARQIVVDVQDGSIILDGWLTREAERELVWHIVTSEGVGHRKIDDRMRVQSTDVTEMPLVPRQARHWF